MRGYIFLRNTSQTWSCLHRKLRKKLKICILFWHCSAFAKLQNDILPLLQSVFLNFMKCFEKRGHKKWLIYCLIDLFFHRSSHMFYACKTSRLSLQAQDSTLHRILNRIWIKKRLHNLCRETECLNLWNLFHTFLKTRTYSCYLIYFSSLTSLFLY